MQAGKQQPRVAVQQTLTSFMRVSPPGGTAATAQEDVKSAVNAAAAIQREVIDVSDAEEQADSASAAAVALDLDPPMWNEADAERRSRLRASRTVEMQKKVQAALSSHARLRLEKVVLLLHATDDEIRECVPISKKAGADEHWKRMSAPARYANLRQRVLQSMAKDRRQQASRSGRSHQTAGTADEDTTAGAGETHSSHLNLYDPNTGAAAGLDLESSLTAAIRDASRRAGVGSGDMLAAELATPSKKKSKKSSKHTSGGHSSSSQKHAGAAAASGGSATAAQELPLPNGWDDESAATSFPAFRSAEHYQSLRAQVRLSTLALADPNAVSLKQLTSSTVPWQRLHFGTWDAPLNPEQRFTPLVGPPMRSPRRWRRVVVAWHYAHVTHVLEDPRFEPGDTLHAALYFAVRDATGHCGDILVHGDLLFLASGMRLTGPIRFATHQCRGCAA